MLEIGMHFSVERLVSLSSAVRRASRLALPATVGRVRLSRGLHARSSLGKRERRWAHQDSNLERAGYEPAALTVELWARC